MLSENRRKQVLQRIQELVDEMNEVQYKSEDQLDPQMNRITVGQYPSTLDFSTNDSANPTKAILRNIEEANGSTFMGLWFMSGAVPLFDEAINNADKLVYVNDPNDKATQVQAFQQSLSNTITSIHSQLQTAQDVPKFFQGGSEEGTTTDIHGCPQYTMGWYPLVDKTRIPAVIPEVIQGLLDFLGHITKEDLESGMSNLSDGDIWSWTISINETTPGYLNTYGEDVLNDPDIYKPLLNTYLRNTYGDPSTTWLSQPSIDLWDRISASSQTGDGYPIETFYEPTQGPKGAFSCAVMGNVLSAIPVLPNVPQDSIQDITDAVLFVRESAKQALKGDITWEEYAYDYYTIPTAPVGYLMRADRTIRERKETNNHPHFPDLLDQEALELVASYTQGITQEILDKGDSILAGNDNNPHAVKGNLDYATLVYCFCTMMNLWKVDPDLYTRTFNPPDQEPDRTLVALTAEMLLTSNEAANRTPGTGPYKLFDVGEISIYVTMGSICFIVPPLLEAYALYLLSEADPST
jgi:hypothetical protein